jgi:uncharacterized protein YbbC (DUF1343 family)
MLGPGVTIRPLHFEPTFQKHACRMCGGGQIHVTDRTAFRPVFTAVAILSAAKQTAPDHFAWREPPYEYETRKPPIDILWGGDGLRNGIDGGASVEEIMASSASECESFGRALAPYLLYD